MSSNSRSVFKEIRKMKKVMVAGGGPILCVVREESNNSNLLPPLHHTFVSIHFPFVLKAPKHFYTVPQVSLMGISCFEFNDLTRKGKTLRKKFTFLLKFKIM